MAMFGIHWWLNLVSLAGIVILAVPVWSLNVRKKKLQEIRQALTGDPRTLKDRVKEILRDRRNRDVTEWRRLDELCLLSGYLALAGSSFLRLFFPVA